MGDDRSRRAKVLQATTPAENNSITDDLVLRVVIALCSGKYPWWVKLNEHGVGYQMHFIDVQEGLNIGSCLEHNSHPSRGWETQAPQKRQLTTRAGEKS